MTAHDDPTRPVPTGDEPAEDQNTVEPITHAGEPTIHVKAKATRESRSVQSTRRMVLSARRGVIGVLVGEREGLEPPPSVLFLNQDFDFSFRLLQHFQACFG